MSYSRSMLRIILVALCLFALILYKNPIGWRYYNELINGVFLLFPFLSVLAGSYAIKAYGYSNTHGKSMLFITAGFASWFIGETLWTIFAIVLHINPYPSIADIFYLLAYVLIFLGIIREIRVYKTNISVLRSLIVCIFSVIVSIVVFNMTVVSAYINGASLIENSIAIGYGIVDLILIITIAHLLILTMDFKGGKIFIMWSYFLAGAIFMLLGDIFFSLYPEQYEQGIAQYKQIDLLWIVSYSLFTVSLFEVHFLLTDAKDVVKKLLAKNG
jgi:hypothetical protein